MPAPENDASPYAIPPLVLHPNYCARCKVYYREVVAVHGACPWCLGQLTIDAEPR